MVPLTFNSVPAAAEGSVHVDSLRICLCLRALWCSAANNSFHAALKRRLAASKTAGLIVWFVRFFGANWTMQIFSFFQQLWWFHSFKIYILEILESWWNSNRRRMKPNVATKSNGGCFQALTAIYSYREDMFFPSLFRGAWPGFPSKIILMSNDRWSS